MDGSRDDDLRALKARMEDQLLPLGERRRAWRSFNKILVQLKDKKLIDLRYRLVRAHRADDADVAEKLVDQIHEHTIRTYGRI